jgi:Flp pilus assembly protein TadG
MTRPGHGLRKGYRLRHLLAAGPREDGGTLVEIAVVMSAFTLFLFGFFNVCFDVFEYASANYAAGMGARYASLHSNTSVNPATTSQVKAIVLQNMFLPPGVNPTVFVQYTQSGNVIGQPVGIGVVYPALPGIAIPNFYVSVQAFRYITH